MGAVRDQTERTTSSWVSGTLDALTSVVRHAVAPPSGGQTQTAQTTEAQAFANARGSPVKPQAETTRKPEPIEGDARVTRQLIDELKKETASTRRSYNEKVKRTRGCSFGTNDWPPHLAVKVT